MIRLMQGGESLTLTLIRCGGLDCRPTGGRPKITERAALVPVVTFESFDAILLRYGFTSYAEFIAFIMKLGYWSKQNTMQEEQT